jgi:hypothetical protein
MTRMLRAPERLRRIRRRRWGGSNEEDPEVPPPAELVDPVLALSTVMGCEWRGSHAGEEDPKPALTPTGRDDPVDPRE